MYTITCVLYCLPSKKKRKIRALPIFTVWGKGLTGVVRMSQATRWREICNEAVTRN